MFNTIQTTEKLILGGNSKRAQETFAIDFCTSQFTTEGEILIFSRFPCSENDGLFCTI